MRLRRLVIALTFLAAFATDSLAQSKRPQPDRNQTQRTEQPAATDQRGTSQSPAIIKILPPDDADTKAKQEADDRAAKDRLDTNTIRLGIASVVVAFLQFVAIGIQAVFLWFAFQAAKSAVNETRRIGEAQVRSYVSIKSAVIFFWGPFEHALVKFVAFNTGQSPARNFIWNVTVQYASGRVLSIKTGIMRLALTYPQVRMVFRTE